MKQIDVHPTHLRTALTDSSDMNCGYCSHDRACFSESCKKKKKRHDQLEFPRLAKMAGEPAHLSMRHPVYSSKMNLDSVFTVDKINAWNLVKGPLEVRKKQYRSIVVDKHQMAFISCMYPGCNLVDGQTELIEIDGNIYCYLHFISKIAPRCYLCSTVILEDLCEIAETYWHPKCANCIRCGCSVIEIGCYMSESGLICLKGKRLDKYLIKKKY
ncbi:hypothetical protein ACOME3_008679 [Neoechinorhynchus agilis]